MVKNERRKQQQKKKKPNQDEDKKSAINKKINSQMKKPHLKRIPNKDKGWYAIKTKKPSLT